MSVFRYGTRFCAHRIGQQAIARGRERVAAHDAAGAEAAYQQAFDALSWAYGEDHIETMPGHSGLAAAAWLAGDWDKAHAFTHGALAITSTLPVTDERQSMAYGNLMQLDWHVGELGSLIDTCTTLLKLPTTTWHATARFHRAVAHRWLGQHQLAREQGQRIAADGGGQHTQDLFLAGVAFDEGRLEEAESAYRKLIAGYSQASTRVAACSRLATVLAVAGGDAEAQLAEAEAAFAELTDEEQESHETILMVDRARVTGRLVDAEALWERVRALPPTHAPCLDALMRCVERAGPDHSCHNTLQTLGDFVRRVYPAGHRFVATASRGPEPPVFGPGTLPPRYKAVEADNTRPRLFGHFRHKRPR